VDHWLFSLTGSHFPQSGQQAHIKPAVAVIIVLKRGITVGAVEFDIREISQGEFAPGASQNEVLVADETVVDAIAFYCITRIVRACGSFCCAVDVLDIGILIDSERMEQ